MQRVVWSPLAGSQASAICCPAHHILYEGSRGPGKTDAQVMYFRQFVGLGYGMHWRGVIFDREYKNLDDLVNKAYRWFPKFNDGARFLRSKGDYKWLWPTGEELLFRQIKRVEDYWNYHGQEFAYIGWNELCKFPTPELYDKMMSCNRTSFISEEHSPNPNKPLPPIKLTVFSTANPYGPGHGWVKKRFIDPAQPGELVPTTTKVFNPRTQQEEDVTKRQVRIFGSYKENRFLTPEYIAELQNQRNPNIRKAWLEGDWNIVAGGALDDLYDEEIHVIPRFPIPSSWRLDRSFDWGSTKPFSVGFWALADGNSVNLGNGVEFCPPKNSLIRFHEIYGGVPDEINTGLKMSARNIAKEIVKTETKLRALGMINTKVNPGPADNSIFDAEPEKTSIATDMQAEGIEWERSDKSPGSRKRGLQVVRDRFQNALTGEGPAVYIMVHCRACLSQLPVLPRDPEDLDDVDTEAEDHVYDEFRYRCVKGAHRRAIEIPTTHTF